MIIVTLVRSMEKMQISLLLFLCKQTLIGLLFIVAGAKRCHFSGLV